MTYLLPHLIEEAADRDADQVAIVCRDDSLTYRQLVERSRSLAHHLIDSGLEAGDRVGILLNKSVDSAVALYGIMMAGGVYVPLDPISPPSRVGFVIRDCGIDFVISDDRRHRALDTLAKEGLRLTSVIGVDRETTSLPTTSWSEVHDSIEPVAERLTELDLCYILYTSGSTGVPKGIMHTHRSALSWAEVTAQVYSITGEDRITNYAPLHFDLSTLDFFGGARGGATVVMIPEEHMKLPASLGALLESERISLFYTVPLALVQLSQPGILDDRDLTALSRVLFGGEPMPMKHLRRIHELVPGAKLFNVYGPTEVNGCTHHEVTRIGGDGDALPIGVPYPNVEALVVDEEHDPVERGQMGELAIRAPTMMRGYWGRPDLNEGAFLFRQRHDGLPDVFHLTGDLVVEGSDGALQFHGRRDRQIKTRGYRVELDEVEAALLANPDVREAAVYAVPADDGGMEIWASVLPAATAAIDPSTLQVSLTTRLPAYAVPTHLSVDETLPRTTTGKIDRRKLAQAAAGRKDQETT